MISSSDIVLLSVFVFFSSFLFSMLGLGGGSIYVPLFYLMHLPLKTVALPLSLALNILTQISASYTFIRNKLFSLPTLLPMLLGVLVLPYPIVKLLPRVSDTTIVVCFVFIMVITASLLLYREKLPKITIPPLLLGGIAGLCGGLLAGLLGLGGGAIMVPLLILGGIKEKQAIANSSICIVFAAGIAFMAHLDHMPWQNGLFILLATSLIASQLGSRFMVAQMKGKNLRFIFASVQIIVSIIMLLKHWINW